MQCGTTCLQMICKHFGKELSIETLSRYCFATTEGVSLLGIYTADPEKAPTATKFDDITYDEVLSRGLKVMDLTATCMCKENKLPIIVFDMDTVGNLKKVMSGENIGTLVHP